MHSNYQEELNQHPASQQMKQKWRMDTADLQKAKLSDQPKNIYKQILNQQRRWLIDKNHEKNTLSEEVILRHLLYLDLEEEKLNFL